MKNYPPEDPDSTRSQNPGPLDVLDLAETPLKKSDDRSDQVAHLQKMLFELGYLLGLGSTMLGTRVIDGVDGIFGGDTDAAVRQFQRDHRDFEGTALVQDGIVGERTADSLNREMVGIRYASYNSLDKDGDLAPEGLPLITLDPDSTLSLKVPLEGDVKKVRVVVHGNGT